MKASQAAKIVFQCGSELYHLERVRSKFGDDQALTYLRRRLQETDQMTPADSSIRAGQILNDVDRLKSGYYDFRGLHRQLEMKRSPSSAYHMADPTTTPA